MRVLGLGILATFAVSCASTTFPKLDVKALPKPPDDSRDAKWLVLLDESEARFEPGKTGPELVLTERWRIKMLRAAEVPPVRAFWSRTFEELVSIRGRIIGPDGVEKPLDLSKQSEQPAFSSSILFSDSRVAIVPVPPIPVGGVFETEVVTRQRSMEHFTVRQTFGGSEPVALARLLVLAPKDWDVRWKVLAYDGATVGAVDGERDGLRTWTFERTDLPATEVEGSGPPLANRLPQVVLRLETWLENGKQKHPPANPEELSRFLARGGDERDVPTPELEATVKKVLEGVEDTREAKARALYEYTCREVQYCAIEIGLGGWFPHPAKDVHAARYGDCKDKANYLRTLLTIAGIPSYNAAIFSHDGSPKEFALPSLGANFNHQIAAVQLPGKIVFADPTWRAVPFGELPPNDQGAPVLIISAEGHDLQMTPESTAADNTEQQKMTLSLQPDGDASGTFSLSATGARALPWKRRWLEGTGQASRWVGEQLWLRAPLIREFTQRTRSDFEKTVEIEGTLGARRIAADAGQGRLLIRPWDVFEPWMQTWDEKRKSPVISRFADTRTITVDLTLPAGSSIATATTERKVESAFGTFRLTTKLEGNTLKIERTLLRKSRRVAVSALPEFNDFVGDVTNAEMEPIFVKLGGAP
ncbi:MAG: DUF3857 domain-containing protein [Archangium sp.]|nr:DUF3857 domain-containing protein [Archangium sp.]